MRQSGMLAPRLQNISQHLSFVRRHSSSVASAWLGTQAVPADPILGLVAAFKADAAPRKVNLAQGAYRTDEGTPFVLPSVVEAEQRVNKALLDGSIDKEYLPIEGDANFRKLSAALVLGEHSAALAEERCATLQTISGTGAVSVAAATLHRVAGISTIYVPDPSWGNHHHIFSSAGLDVRSYAYLDHSTGTTLDFEAMHSALSREVPEGSAILLHACAHNPTGIDPTPQQWQALADVFVARGLIAVFDSAYQVCLHSLWQAPHRHLDRTAT